MSANQRKLFMHSAHRTIGVAGEGNGLRPYYRTESPFLPDGPHVLPLRITLVADNRGADARVLLALFRQTVEPRGNMDCRIEWAGADVPLENIQDADCVVVFRQGLHIMQPLAASPYLAQWQQTHENVADFRGDEPIEVVIPMSSKGHPILEGVRPFASRVNPATNVPVSDDAQVLLVSRMANEDRPTAWLEDGHRGRVFHTILGTAEDFRQSDFIRLLLNALQWIGR